MTGDNEEDGGGDYCNEGMVEDGKVLPNFNDKGDVEEYDGVLDVFDRANHDENDANVELKNSGTEVAKDWAWIHNFVNDGGTDFDHDHGADNVGASNAIGSISYDLSVRKVASVLDREGGNAALDDDSEDEDYMGDDEDEVVTSDGLDTDDEEVVEVREKVKKFTKNMREACKEWNLVAQGTYLSCGECTENDEEYWDERDPSSPPFSSDGEESEKRSRYPTFNPKSKPNDVSIELGCQFMDNVEFKMAINDYGIMNGYDLKFIKNDKKYIQVKCFGSSVENTRCLWHVSAAWMQKKKNFQVVSIGTEHTCRRVTHKNSRLSAKWLARHYMERVKLAPSWKIREFQSTIWHELRLKATIHMCFRALSICHQQIEGDFKEQYERLWDYVAEIKRANPNNNCFLKVKEEGNVFEKIYICFDAMKKAWKDGCRPLLGVDGCFLKGCIEGQILVVVGVDGNNQMFPVAWSVVEKENTENWVWFLHQVVADLSLHQGNGLTIISDQQKGLVEAIKRILPQVEHRCCARHIYANFRKKFNGLVYRKHFWMIANATTPNMFADKMRELKEFDEKAALDLEGRNPTLWSKAWFKLHSSCDYVTNNITEIFNGSIIQARHKPILGMLEDMREACMKRNIKKRDAIKNVNIILCPRIQKLVDERKEAASIWNCVWNGMDGYEVKVGNNPLGDRYTVKIESRSCSCRAWQLSGIPCEHAVAAIWEMRDEPEGYVSHWYTKNTYLKTYNHTMELLNGPNEWPRQMKQPIVPPEARKWRGRPRRKRRKEVGETHGGSKVSRRTQEQRCSNCSQTGHNKQYCQNPGVSMPTHLRYKRNYKAPDESRGRAGRGNRGRGAQSQTIHYPIEGLWSRGGRACRGGRSSSGRRGRGERGGRCMARHENYEPRTNEQQVEIPNSSQVSQVPLSTQESVHTNI